MVFVQVSRQACSRIIEGIKPLATFILYNHAATRLSINIFGDRYRSYGGVPVEKPVPAYANVV